MGKLQLFNLKVHFLLPISLMPNQQFLSKSPLDTTKRFWLKIIQISILHTHLKFCVTKKRGSMNPTADTLPTTDPAEVTLLISLSSTADTDFLHTTTSFWVRSTDRLCRSQEHIIRHNAHFPQCLLTQMHQSACISFTSYIYTPTAQVFSFNTKQQIWSFLKFLFLFYILYSSAART